jgi:predicted ATPase
MFVVISGCSGGGKSTLIAELARRGYACVEEPGRRVVRNELAAGGSALPWLDAEAFMHRVVALALSDLAAASESSGDVFFDRGLIDAVAGLHFVTGAATSAACGHLHRYHRRIFLVPPWPQIYATDTERRHDFTWAASEYRRLLDVYPSLGFEPANLPKIGVSERADFVLQALSH